MSYRRGIIREVDGKTGRARVEFQDQDGVVSWWLNVNSALASGKGSRSFIMPETGSQVNCLVDANCEEGTILGALYSDEDQPAQTDPNNINLDLGGGLKLNYDKGAGKLTLAVPNGTVISAGGSEYVINPDGITLNAAAFTVNAPTTFTKGISVSGGGGATMKVDGSMQVSQSVAAGQEVSAPVLRGNVVG